MRRCSVELRVKTKVGSASRGGRVWYLREGLLRLFFKPMLLLVLPRRPVWFFTASSHMPMPPEEEEEPTPLPSMPPHMPTPSLHWLPREELPIDKPECWRKKKTAEGVMCVFTRL